MGNKPSLNTGCPRCSQFVDRATCLRLAMTVLQLNVSTVKSNRNSKQAAGLAILDTGASRSVIGNDHVPSVLGKLPASIRAQVRECPSKVGFRFGNNQIAYSFKQLQIPLMHQKQRIWLLIEVVPKATPFLLSIKTMKSLGAHIDLSQNTCYLQTLNRSLPLKENQNGLIVIDMADLCQPPEKESEAAFLVFKCPYQQASRSS